MKILFSDSKEISIVYSVVVMILGLLLALASMYAYDQTISMIFTCIGIIIILINIFPLLAACTAVQHDKRYISDIVFYGISVALGSLFIFDQSKAVSIVFGFYLIAMPIFRIVVAKDKLRRFKKELPLFIVASLMIFNVFNSVLRIALIVAGFAAVVYGIVNLILTFVKKDSSDDDDSSGSVKFYDRGDTTVIDAEVKEL